MAANCFAPVGTGALGLVYTDSEENLVDGPTDSKDKKPKRAKHKKHKSSETDLAKHRKKTKKDKKRCKDEKHHKHKYKSSKEKNSCRKKVCILEYIPTDSSSWSHPVSSGFW